ncbi:MAG: M24 family metallopeptidase [Chloroflexota bacterium]
MAFEQFFTQEEYDQRLARLRQEMQARDLDACLISQPENIYYLTGLDHFGYFAYHALLVTHEGPMALIARAMEQVTMDLMLVNTVFYGFEDGQDHVAFTLDVLRELDVVTGALGLEKASFSLQSLLVEAIAAGLPRLQQRDVSGLVDRLRQRRSAQEIAYIRRAATVADAMMQAAVETAAAGVGEREVVAEVQRAMALAGGEWPGFGPFIRSGERLGEEHRTWSDHVLRHGDALFVELAGCARRYHAAMGRLLFVGQAPAGCWEMSDTCLDAFQAAASAMRPGVCARDVYAAWQDCVDGAGLSHCRRHHCGYLIGAGFPPSWVGGNMVVGLRHDSDLRLEAGMTFHLMSWLMGAGRDDNSVGDYFVSDTVLVTEQGAERLTTVPQELQVV